MENRKLTPGEERFLVEDMSKVIQEEFKNKVWFSGRWRWSAKNIARRILEMPEIKELIEGRIR